MLIVAAQLSQRLTGANWAQYRQFFNTSFAKRSLRDLQSKQSEGAGDLLLVHPSVTDDGLVTITYQGPDDGGPASVVIYDSRGFPLFIPAGHLALRGRATERFTFTGHGVYFVTLLHRGESVASVKIVYRE